MDTEGPVFRPGDPAYDDERTGYQLRSPHAPDLVVGVTGTADVVAAVRHAAAHGLPFAVQSSGHGLAAPLTTGVLISTRRMRGVRVDPRTRTAWVAAGASNQDVLDAAAPHGLAPLLGSSPGVGAVSYTLGGGVGLLARPHGWAADRARRFELVTPDGELHDVDADSDPELFWALRGAGGGLGVVTGMEVELVELDVLTGGGIYVDAGANPGVVDAWREWTGAVPEATTSAIAVLPFPDVPAVPEGLRGRHVAQLQISHAGPVAEADAVLAPLRELAGILRDTVREVPVAEMAGVFEEPDRPHAYRSATALLPDLTGGDAAHLLASAGPAAPAMTVVSIRHLGGALSRPPAAEAAIAHRDAAYSITALSPLEPGAEDTVRRLHRDVLAPFAGRSRGRLLNFGYGPSDDATVAEAFPGTTRARLAALRTRHDPAGLLRPNHTP